MIPKIPNQKAPKYGFQKSENTRAVATIYQHHKDPTLVYGKQKSDTFTLKGNRGDHDDPSLISIAVTKNINRASGTFQIVLKPSMVSVDLFRTISDDDWVDITFWVGNNPYNNFRGLIDEVNESKTVSNGATVTMYVITGRCFGKIWESTPVWFSPYYNDIITEATTLTSKALDGAPNAGGAPDTLAILFLKEFLQQNITNEGPNWYVPSSLPGTQGNIFINNIEFNLNVDGVTSKYFQNNPKRRQFNQKLAMPEGVLWDLAKEFSDPIFTEMYTDYLPQGNPFNKHFDSPVSDGGAKMCVVIRDRPFPVLPTSAPIGYKNTWNDIPVMSVYPQEIINSNVSKGGYERYNAFYVASMLHQEEINNHALEIKAPLINKTSIGVHGLKRYDLQIPTFPEIEAGVTIDDLCSYQRQIIKDWYCLNPYFLSGSITLGHGRPDIHIGCRVNIPGIIWNNKEILPERNFYVEEVGHTWTFGQGTRTNLGVTRGWIGNDDSYTQTLSKVSSQFELADLLAEPSL